MLEKAAGEGKNSMSMLSSIALQQDVALGPSSVPLHDRSFQSSSYSHSTTPTATATSSSNSTTPTATATSCSNSTTRAIASPVERRRSGPQAPPPTTPTRSLADFSSDESSCVSAASSPASYASTDHAETASTGPSSSRSPSRPRTTDTLSFWYTNATSLNNKMHLLEAVVATEAPTIIEVTETWFDSNSVAELAGYQLFRSDRPNGRTGGGVCIYVQNGVQAMEPVDKHLLGKDCEQVWLSIQLDNSNLLVGCIYRPPPQPASDTSRATDNSISKSISAAACMLANKNFSSVVLLGDFNLPDVEWSEYGAPILASLESPSALVSDAIGFSSLVQLVSEDTFFAGQSGSLLDLVLVSDSNRVSELEIGSPLVSNPLRSHCSIRFQYHARAAASGQFDSRKLDWRRGDYDAMAAQLESQNWTSIVSQGSVQECYSAFLGTFGSAATMFVQQRRPWTRNSKPPWWNGQLAYLVRRKMRLFIASRIDKKNKQLKTDHRTACRQVKVTVKKSVMAFELKLAEDSKSNPKKLYAYINRRFGARETITALKSQDGQLVTDGANICNIISEFFFSVFSPPTSPSIVSQASEKFAARAQPDRWFTVDDVVTRDKVFLKLKNLNSDKTAGVDQMPAHALKMCAEALAGPLALIFKHSLRDASLPSEWRTANVSPIFKRGSRTAVENYRPVSLTSVPCKVLESLVKDYIINHLQLHNLISTKQHGFVAHRACVTNLLETIDFMTDSISRRLPADVIYLDFSKAFDKVSHELLLVKLVAYGIPRTLVEWIRAFLTDRRQRVIIGNSMSEWKPVTSGVPQGSVLGPLLFVIFINDMPEVCKSILKLYADDSKLLSHVQREEHANQLQQDLNSLIEWADQWQMSFNKEKCVVMHLGADNGRFDYKMGDGILSKTNSERDLGIVITSDLKSSEQSRRAAARATMVACRIKNTFTYFNRQLVNLLYKSFVRPHLEFAVSAWNPYRRSDIEVLEKVQRRFSKLAPDLKSKPYVERRQALGWTTLEDRRRRGDLIQLHKIQHGKDRVELIHGNQRIASSGLDSPAGRTRRGHMAVERQLVRSCRARHNFFTNRIAGSWNALDDTTKNTGNTNNFKNRIDKFFGFS